jgi:hypothetical protein
MSNENLSNEDVSAMRRQGDLKAFLRQAIRTGQHTQRENLRPAAPSLPAAPGHIPGAWPVGPSDPEASARTTCICTRCRSYAKGQPDRNHPST